MKEMYTLLLKRSELSKLLSLDEYIEGIEQAFLNHGKGNTFGTGMIHGDTLSEVEFHIKVGGLKLNLNDYYGLKINGSSFNNMEKYGLPNIMGVVVLFDAEKGFPLAVVDAGDPTVKRTGASTAVAAKYLARKDSKVATICGCGTQGKIQLKSLMKIFSLEKIFAFDQNYENAVNYAKIMDQELSETRVEPIENLKDGVPKSDIIVTCTPSKKPFLKKQYIKTGTFIAAVGADSPDKQELDSEILKGNKIITDITVQCQKAGELHHALEKGLLQLSDVHGQLGEVIAKKVKGRENDEEIIIYDATGTALQDTTAAALCYEKALKEKMGVKMNFFE